MLSPSGVWLDCTVIDVSNNPHGIKVRFDDFMNGEAVISDMSMWLSELDMQTKVKSEALPGEKETEEGETDESPASSWQPLAKAAASPRLRESANVRPSTNEGDTEPAYCSVSILVPTTAVGNIIGKGGSTIKAIEAKSSAKCAISMRINADDEQIVTLRGDLEAIGKAELFIFEKVLSQPAKTAHEIVSILVGTGCSWQ